MSSITTVPGYTPTRAQDVATKAYVDSKAGGSAGVPTFIQQAQPTYSSGPYIWYQTDANGVVQQVWYENGVTGTSTLLESFTGADGSSWPANWNTFGDVSPVLASNQGKLQAATSQTYRGAIAYGNGFTSVADFNRTVEFVLSDTGDQWDTFAMRTTNTTRDGGESSQPTTGCGVHFGPTGMELFRGSTGGAVSLTSTLALSLSAGVRYTMRLQGSGTTLSAKVWQTSGGEPAATASNSLSSTNASTPVNSGYPWLGFRGGSDSVGRSVLWDNLTSYP